MTTSVKPLSLLLILLISLLTAEQLFQIRGILPALFPSCKAMLLFNLLTPGLIILSAILHRLVPAFIILPLLHLYPGLFNDAFPLISLICLTAIYAAAAFQTRLTTIISLATTLITTQLLLQYPSLHSTIPTSSLHFAPHILVSLVATVLFTRPTPLSVASARRHAKPRKRKSLLQIPPVVRPYVVFITALAIVVLCDVRPMLDEFVPMTMPHGHIVLAQESSNTGLISVVERPGKYRMLVSDYSVLGGYHISPEHEHSSIFSQFYLHEAVRLTNLPEETLVTGGRNGKSLCLGLGVGVVANAFAMHKSEVDAVELDPVIAKYARSWFGLKARPIVGDAVSFVNNASEDEYDYVIHDVFTGGSIASSLVSMEFWNAIRNVMKHDGVLAVNLVGATDNSTMGLGVATVFWRLKHVFGHVRVFSDAFENEKTHNVVLFAANVPERVTFRKPDDKDSLGINGRLYLLQNFESREVTIVFEEIDLKESDWMSDFALNMAAWELANEHEDMMKKVHGEEIWKALLAKYRRETRLELV